MRPPLIVLAASALLVPPGSSARGEPLAYPPAARGDVVDEIHGVKVADPYRWLEQIDSPQTRAWLDAERALTDRYIGALPGRERIEQELLAANDYERVSTPDERGGRLFYTLNTGLQNQPVLYVADAGEDADGAAPRALIDFNAVSLDGSLAFAGFVASPRGTYVAYGLSHGGGDWTEWRVCEVATGRDLPDRIEWTKYYDPTWTADESAFYYSRFPQPPAGKELLARDVGCQLRLHRLGADPQGDPVIYERPDHQTWQFEPAVTDDGAWLVITIGDGQVGDRGLEAIYLLDLRAADRVWPFPLTTGFDAEYIFVAKEGPLFYVETNASAPNGKLVAIDYHDPSPAKWRTIVPETDQPINGVVRSGDRFYVTRLVDACSRLFAVSLDGKTTAEIALPAIGTAHASAGLPAQRLAIYSFTTFTAAPTVYRYDPRTGRSTSFHPPRAVIDPADFVVEEIFYASKDGTRIPMFVAHRKDLPLDGERPTLLTGYGGFATSVGPRFSPTYAWWLSRGGVFAEPCLRGGAEYGEAWHESAIKTRKQTTFDDFIAAADRLIADKYTRPGRLMITGGSNGGLLVGAALTQRPDLFGAVVVHVGVLDMLRFQLAGQGQGWEGDYGSIAVPDEFRALLAYSPLQNVRPGTSYPPTLIVTGDHDTRVAPWHSFKFAAALQAAQAGPAPVLLKLESTAGHGGGTRLRARLADTAEIYVFVFRALGIAP